MMGIVKNPIELSERLCLAGLIPRTVLEDVRDSNVYKHHQGMAILFKSRTARERMSSNPDLFQKFLGILVEVGPSDIQEVVKNMKRTFQQGKRTRTTLHNHSQ